MHVVTKLSPRTKNASVPSQGEAESDTSAPTINEQDGPVWRDPLENPSFITTSPTTTMSQDDLYPNSLSMILQSPLPLTDTRSFASQLEASLLASNLTAATTTLNSTTSSSSSSQDLRNTIGNNNVTTTSTAESNSKKDSKGDLHDEETKPTALVPSNDAHSHSNTHSRDSSVHSPLPVVKETLDACITVSPTGMLQVKQYELRRIIGQGAFGIVNLGVDVNTGIKYVSLFVCFLVFIKT